MYETAMKLFTQHGFAGTTLQDIATAMGVTRPALYYYVKGKDELLANLVAEITESNTTQIVEIAHDAILDPVEKLSRIAYLLAHNRAVHPSGFLLLARSEAELSGTLAVVHEKTKRTMLHTLITVIKQGIEAGRFRPVSPRTAALAVTGMCNWVASWSHEEDVTNANDVAGHIADMAVSSLIQSSDRAAGGRGPRAAAALLRQDLAYLERLLDDAEGLESASSDRMRTTDTLAALSD